MFSTFMWAKAYKEYRGGEIGEKGEQHNKKECTALLAELKEKGLVSNDKTIEFLEDWWKKTYAYATIHEKSPDGNAFLSGRISGGSKDTAKLYEKSKSLLARA